MNKQNLIWLAVIFLVTASTVLLYYQAKIVDKDYLRAQEPELFERLQFLDGNFDPAKFEEPRFIGNALINYPAYKLLGDTILFIWYLKLTYIIFLSASIYLLSKMLRIRELSLLLLAYPFTHLFYYHTTLDLFLLVLSIYLVRKGKRHIMYYISPFLVLFRPEYLAIPLTCIVCYREYKKVWYVLLGIGIHYSAQYWFYGAGDHLANQYVIRWLTKPDVGITGTIAYAVGLLVSVMTIVIYQIRRTINWEYLYAVISNLIYIVSYLIAGADIARYAYYSLALLILKGDELLSPPPKKPVKKTDILDLFPMSRRFLKRAH